MSHCKIYFGKLIFYLTIEGAVKAFDLAVLFGRSMEFGCLHIFCVNRERASGNLQLFLSKRTRSAWTSWFQLILIATFRKQRISKKKDTLIRSLAALEQEKKVVQRGEKKVKPLRAWVLDTKQAMDLISSDDLHEISDFVRRFGTNPNI